MDEAPGAAVVVCVEEIDFIKVFIGCEIVVEMPTERGETTVRDVLKKLRSVLTTEAEAGVIEELVVAQLSSRWEYEDEIM